MHLRFCGNPEKPVFSAAAISNLRLPTIYHTGSSNVRTSLSLAFLFLLAISFNAVAQQPRGFLASPPVPDKSVYDALTASSTRTVIALSGSWEVSDDDGDSWKPLAVPSCYNESGKLLMRRKFNIPKEMLNSYSWKLVGYGLQYSGSISVNGSFIVQRESLIPFTANLPEESILQPNNTIQIEVDNRLEYASTVPGRRLPLDIRTYGGVVRDIFLVGTPRVRIDDVKILRKGGGTADFEVNVVSGTIKGMKVGRAGDSAGVGSVISGDQSDFNVSIVVRSPSGVDTIPAGEVARGEQQVTLQSKRTALARLAVNVSGATPWRPGAPSLYTAVIQVRHNGALVDEKLVRFGFRDLKTAGEQVTLNGSPLRLKGVVYIEDSEKYGASLSYEQMREDMQTIRDMGVNVIRFTGSVPHPYLLELCDQMGVLAFIDVPIGSPPPFLYHDEEFFERALDRTRSAIEATRQYSCVVGYGVGFPFGVDPGEGEEFLAQVRKSIDSLAPGSLFYAAATAWSNPKVRDLVDIAGISLLDGTPEAIEKIIGDARAQLAGAKPLVLLGFGKLVRVGNQSGYSDPTSTQSQAKFLSDVYMILERSGIAGGIYWAYNDYRTDRPLLTVNNADQYIASCGLVTLGREVRIAGKTLGALYTDQRPPDIAIGEYNAPSTVLFIIIGIACAIAFLLLINNSRRFRENVFRALLRPYNFYADIRDQRILSTVQTTVLGGVIAVTFAVIFSSLCYYYRMDEAFDFVLGALLPSDGLKELIDYVIWRPPLSVIAFTLFFFLLLVIVTLLIRFGSVFVRNKIFFNDAYTISIWGALPVLLLIPLGMILTRLLVFPSAGILAFMVVLAILLWLLYRVLRGTAVIYDVRSSRVYLYAIGGMVVLVVVLCVASDNIYAMFSYVRDGIGAIYARG